METTSTLRIETQVELHATSKSDESANRGGKEKSSATISAVT